MHCPYCRTPTPRCSIRGRRGRREHSSAPSMPVLRAPVHHVEQMQLVVVKRSGVVEPFQRDKVISGVRKACKGRPVTEDQLARLGQLVEDSVRASGQPEMPADEVGVAILGPLRELDQVAYLRFASVYRQFRSVDDFEAEIALAPDRAGADRHRAAHSGPARPTRRSATSRRTGYTPNAADSRRRPALSARPSMGPSQLRGRVRAARGTAARTQPGLHKRLEPPPTRPRHTKAERQT